MFYLTGAVATVERTAYTVNEDAGFANIAILLDQASCIDVTVVVTPREQTPVDASCKKQLFIFVYFVLYTLLLL